MPRNTRNVWLDASIDGRGSRLSGGPASQYGGLSATVLQRSNGGIGDARTYVRSLATSGGTIVTEARMETNGNRYGRPSLVLHTHRDEPGETFTLDVPGLTGAGTSEEWPSTSAVLSFRSPVERDAFLSTLAVWRDAQVESATVGGA